MTANEIYSMPPIKTTADLWAFAGHFQEVDADRISAGTCPGLECRIYADECFDGERTWTFGVMALDDQPFMLIQNAGRGGRDHDQRFVTNCALYQKSVSRMRELYEQMEAAVDPDKDIPDLTQFYSQDLRNFYDPALKPRHKVGDVLLVSVREDHLSYTNCNKITTRVRVESVQPFNPFRTYHGSQLDRRVESGKTGCKFVDAPANGNMGASFSDEDVMGIVSRG